MPVSLLQMFVHLINNKELSNKSIVEVLLNKIL